MRVSPHDVYPSGLVGHNGEAAELVERDVARQPTGLQSTDAFQSVRVQHRDLTRGPQTGVHDALIGSERNLVRRRREFPSHDLSGWQMDEIQPATLVAAIQPQPVAREGDAERLAPQFIVSESREAARIQFEDTARFPGRYVHAIAGGVNRQLSAHTTTHSFAGRN